MNRLLFCAYREWALTVASATRDLHPAWSCDLVRDPSELTKRVSENGLPDVIIAIGWSWIIERPVVDGCWTVGIHPSDLPNYAGGSPIQHQILDGVTEGKNTLFRITPTLDGGPILGKVPLRLDGHMSDIFDRLTQTSIILIHDFLRAFPNIPQEPQGPAVPRRRLTPEQSRLSPSDFSRLSARQLYDIIRCREDPYPNAFIQDSTGLLLLKRADFDPL